VFIHQVRYKLKSMGAIDSYLSLFNLFSSSEAFVSSSIVVLDTANDEWKRMVIMDEKETMIDENLMSEMKQYAEEITVEVISKEKYTEGEYNSFMMAGATMSFNDFMNQV